MSQVLLLFPLVSTRELLLDVPQEVMLNQKGCVKPSVQDFQLNAKVSMLTRSTIPMNRFTICSIFKSQVWDSNHKCDDLSFPSLAT